MTKARLVKSQGSQVVRLPKDLAFPESVTEVTIARDGARRILAPVDASWDDFFDAPGIDLPEREQPEPRGRDPL